MSLSPRQKEAGSLDKPKKVEEAIRKLSLFKERFEPVISRFFAQEIQKTLKLRPELKELLEVGAEFTLRGGKRLRPAFVFYGYKAARGRDEEAVIYASMSVELLHAGILIHDDIIDNSDRRRGKPTVHCVLAESYKDDNLGRSLAIVVGNILLALANQVLSEAPFPEERIKRAMFYFNKMHMQVNQGQYLDTLANISAVVDFDWAMKVMEYKTAGYTIEKPLLIGGALGDASSELLEAFSRYAIPLGIAFQIRDDILGMFGDEKKVGKPVDSDLKEGKKTLLVLETLRRLSEKGSVHEEEKFRRILGNPGFTQEDYLWVQQVIRETGALKYSQDLAYSLILQAKQVLGPLNIEDEAKKYLLGIADFILAREY